MTFLGASTSDITGLLPLPAGLTAGSLVIALVDHPHGGTTAPTPPSGFTLLLSDTGGSGGNGWVYTKRATASEPSAGWLWSGQGVQVQCVAYAPWVTVDQAVAGNSATTVYDNETLVGLEVAGSSTGVPTGFTQRTSHGSGSNIAIIGDKTQATHGATGTLTWPGSGTPRFLITLTGNVAPNAPTLLGPPDTSTVDVTSDARFSWAFSDPDPADSQSKFDLRYSPDSGATWTTVSGTTPNNYVDIASGTFTDGVSYEWQVRTYDAHGVIGPWSSSRFFTAGTPPVGPTVTYPTAGGIVAYSDRVDWSYPTQTAYQVRRVADVAGAADTSTVYYDSGEVDDPVARTAPVIFDVNSRAEHVQLRVKSGGLWSAWVDRLVNVSYSPPPTPVVAVTVGDSSISVTITTAAPTGGGPAAEYADVYVSEDAGETWTRLATALPPNGTWTWWTPASGVDYTFRVATVAASGATVYSDWTDWLLIEPGDAASDAPLIDPGGSSADEEIYDGGGA